MAFSESLEKYETYFEVHLQVRRHKGEGKRNKNENNEEKRKKKENRGARHKHDGSLQAGTNEIIFSVEK